MVDMEWNVTVLKSHFLRYLFFLVSLFYYAYKLTVDPHQCFNALIADKVQKLCEFGFLLL